MAFPLPGTLTSINLEGPELVVKLREDEKENEKAFFKGWIYSLSSASSFNRYLRETRTSRDENGDIENRGLVRKRILRRIKKKNLKLNDNLIKSIEGESLIHGLHPLILRFLLWKTIVFGYRGLSDINKNPVQKEKVNLGYLIGYMADALAELGKLNENPKIKKFCLEKAVMMYEKARNSGNTEIKFVGRNENAYLELEKNSKDASFRIKCLEKALELMEKYPDEGVAEFIGRRAEVYLDFGQLEKDKAKKIEYFLKAYDNSRKQIEDLNDDSLEAVFKLSKICNLFSSRDVGQKLKEKKLEVIEKGISIVKLLRQKQIEEKTFSNPITDNILGFFHIRKARLDYDPSKSSNSFQEGLSLVGDCLKKLNPGYFNRNTSLIFSYAGVAFSEASEIKTESDTGELSVGESDLENLVIGITCSELSRDFGNDEPGNYQVIGRKYYDFQNLIEKFSRNNVKGITPQTIKKVIKKVLMKEGTYDLIFGKYEGGLRDMDKLEDKISKLELEMQWIALQSALESFEKSALAGDDSEGNKSYQGMCIVDLVRLNNWLKKYSGAEIRGKLEDAEKKLKTALEERLKERPEDLYKDYTRLAECQFRLAELEYDISSKKSHYNNSINNYVEAIKLVKGKVSRETLSFLAFSHYKLGKISTSFDKKEHLDKAIRYFDLAYKKGDKSPENRSKKGNCYLDLLKIQLKENSESDLAKTLVEKTKETLEEAIGVSERNEREFYYPYCLLAEMSDILVDNKLVERYNDLEELTKKYNWLTVVKKLFENKKYLGSVIKSIESKKDVFVVDDEYGLMTHDLIIKKSENRKELANQFLWDKFIYDGMRDRGVSSDSVLSSRPICLKEESSNEFYYVMRRSKGVNLDEKFESSTDPLEDNKKKMIKEETEKTLKNFAKFHGGLINLCNIKNDIY